MWRPCSLPWVLLVIYVGGCGAGLSLQTSSNAEPHPHGSPSTQSSVSPPRIPHIQILDTPTCPALAPADPVFPNVTVAAGNVQELMKQLRNASPGTTVMLERGVYALDNQQSLRLKVPGLTLRGVPGNRDAVRIEGGASSIMVAANHVTIADLTVAGSHFHAIQVRGELGVSHTKIYNVHLVDSGQQFVKVSATKSENGPYGDDGLVACSLIEYTTYSKGNGHTPATYTNAIDILAGKNWVVRDNVIRRIRSKDGPAGPAILVWKNAQNTVIKRNRIVDSWRGIALGLMHPGKRSRGGPEVPYDHQNGVVENNVILAIREPADAAIENNFARGSKIYHNTIFYRLDLPHQARWSIEYRFSTTQRIEIRNNLTNLPIRMRRPFPLESAVTGGNVTTADVDWFVDVLNEDVHLVRHAVPVVEGLELPGTHLDLDGTTRSHGQGPDVGADEYEPATMSTITAEKDQ